MLTLIFFSLLAILSFGGAVFLLGRRIVSVRFLNADEQKSKMTASPLFFDFVREDVIRPFEEFVASVARPAMLKLGEKFLRRFRILVLKVEALLHRLSDYFHGKRIAIKNGNGLSIQAENSKNAEFWGEMREFKNRLQNGESNKPEDNSKNNNLPG